MFAHTISQLFLLFTILTFQDRNYYLTMLTYILAATIILLAYCVYQFIIKPKKAIARMVEGFQKQGLVVLELPYKPVGAPFFEMIAKAQKEKKDSFYEHKHSLYNYDLVVTNVLNHPEIIVLNHEIINEVFASEKQGVLIKHNGPYETFLNIIKNGIVMAEGQDWKKRKRIFANIFNFDFVASQLPKMVALSDKVLDQFQDQYWTAHPQDKEKKVLSGEIFNVVVKFTSSVVVTSFIGMESMKEQLRGKSITELIVRLSDIGCLALKDPLIILFGSRFQKLRLRQNDKEFLQLHDQINAILKTYVKTERENMLSNKDAQNPTQKSIIHQLLLESQKSKQSHDNFYLNEDQLIDEIKTFAIAGADTTSNFFTAMLFYIFENPAILSRLQRQISQVIKCNEDMTLENFKKMNYLDCIMNETSRIFSSTYGLFQRQFCADAIFSGVQVEKGTCIAPNWMAFFYNPKYFQRPHQFWPERWQKQEYKKMVHHVSLIFSGGVRGCVGKSLALTELKVFTIKFLQRYHNLTGQALTKKSFSLLLVNHLNNSEARFVKI